MAGAPTVRTHAIQLVGGRRYGRDAPISKTEVIPEVKGVEAFPPVYFNNEQKQKSKGKMKK